MKSRSAPACTRLEQIVTEHRALSNTHGIVPHRGRGAAAREPHLRSSTISLQQVAVIRLCVTLSVCVQVLTCMWGRDGVKLSLKLTNNVAHKRGCSKPRKCMLPATPYGCTDWTRRPAALICVSPYMLSRNMGRYLQAKQYHYNMIII